MNIVHVLNTAKRRGAEVFASDLILQLNRAGVSQVVLVLGPPSDAQINYAGDVRFLDLSGRRPWELGRAGGSLRKIVDDASIVQAYGMAAQFLSVVSAVHSRARLVYRRLGITPDRLRRPGVRAAQRALITKAHRIVAVSQGVAADLVTNLRIPPESIVVIPRGVDPSRLDGGRPRNIVRDSWRVPRTAFLVLSLGSLTWEKDPLAALRITQPLLARDMNAFHVFVGDGPLGETVREEAQQFSVLHQVRIFPNTKEVAEVYRASDTLLLTSRIEGMSGVAIEAGLSGLPVISFDVGGLKEAVLHETTGLIAPPRDERTLSEHLLRVAANADLARSLGAAAIGHTRKYFLIHDVAARYLQLYRELLPPP